MEYFVNFYQKCKSYLLLKARTYSLPVSLSLVILALSFTTPGKIGNLKTIDFFQKSLTPHPEIIILAIDNKSISQFGRWPWSREIHTQIINKLSDYNPRIIGYDVTFSEEEDQQTDNNLATSIKNIDAPVVLASQIVEVTGGKNLKQVLLPIKTLTDKANVSVGTVNVPLDEDGISRKFPQKVSLDSNTYLPFSLQMANQLKADLPQESLISFVGKASSFPVISIADFLNQKVSDNILDQKIILIGATAPDLHDTVLIPNGVISGVEWHATVLDNILLNRKITLLPLSYPLAIGGLILFLFTLTFQKIPAKFISGGLLGIIVLLPLVSLLLWQIGVVLFYFTNLILTAALFVFNSIYRWIISEAEKRKLRQTFEPYFSPIVLNSILKDPSLLKLGGQRKEVSVLFSDIRNFTTITESLPAEKLTKILHEYFTVMSKEILQTDGVLDKFIGDAIMAFWGAPVEQKDHADRAVKTAINMHNNLKKLQKKWQKLGYPHIDAGVGINSGVVTVGNMGSEDRFDYTVIGDVVNAAARLEGLNKQYHSHIIISQQTKSELKIDIKTKSLGEVIVKGKTKPIAIYTVVV